MLQHEALTSILRWFDEEPKPGTFQAFVACCVVLWETPDTIWIQALSGQLNRKRLREFLVWLRDNNIKTVKAHRIVGHVLPGGVVDEGGVTIISVEPLVKRFLTGQISQP